ncbi:hypothetical protein SLEP1_g12556 [Rubroshorea leprosula]|uniref:Uncharacterized protein n=1 Tax=Rubroshorea leprosula TaxID=152421 RepID=A0AAV5IN23_9ROSI|nr:hypothetical protein SLEP1_g12556 [Rubroshorea leprosula]
MIKSIDSSSAVQYAVASPTHAINDAVLVLISYSTNETTSRARPFTHRRSSSLAFLIDTLSYLHSVELECEIHSECLVRFTTE